jgi:hypothetical protein
MKTGYKTEQTIAKRHGADIEPASLAAWRLLMEQVISSADPAIAFIGFLQTMQALPKRPLSQPRYPFDLAEDASTRQGCLDRMHIGSVA